MKKQTSIRRQARGMVLVSALLLLLVVTIMAIAMFRNYGIGERIAGNVREKQRAVHVAQTAEQFAEYWLTRDNNAASNPIQCGGSLDANAGEGQICANLPSDPAAGFFGGVTSVPWKLMSNNANPGVTYTPANMVTTSSVDITNYAQNGGIGTYYAKPQFYISDLGKYAGPGIGEVFQIDAVGYGTTADAVAVIESTYLVGPEVVNLGGL